MNFEEIFPGKIPPTKEDIEGMFDNCRAEYQGTSKSVTIPKALDRPVPGPDRSISGGQ